MGDQPDPSNAEILSALQGMWRQQSDLIKGVEARLGHKLDVATEGVESRLSAKIDAAEASLGARLAQEVQDRPVVVHVDMSRVTELEKRLDALTTRLAELEHRVGS